MPRSSKYTKSAKGRECTVRIPGVCNFDPETTVLAHLNGAGMGIKHDDRHAAFCCSACHDVIDGRVQIKLRDYSACGIKLMHHQGVIRTQQIWIAEGLM